MGPSIEVQILAGLPFNYTWRVGSGGKGDRPERVDESIFCKAGWLDLEAGDPGADYPFFEEIFLCQKLHCGSIRGSRSR